MAEPFAPYAGIDNAGLTGGEGGDVLHKLLMGVIGGTVQIPQHIIQAAQQTAPGLRREDMTDIPGAGQPADPLVKQSTDVALNLAGSSMPFALPGAAGVFGGRLAATADKAKLAKAEEMAAAGADRRAIWDETGWFKGGDDKWRFEIPDYKSQMNQGWHDNGVPNGEMSPIAGQLWHKPLYDAYPDMRRITGMTEKTAAEGGSYRTGSPGDARTFGADEMVNIQAPNAPAARSVALHEMQHAVQEREGFARGGSPSMFTQGEDAQLAREALAYRRELADLDPHLTPKQKDAIVRKRYEDAGAPEWLPGQQARDVAHDVEGNPAETLQRVMQLYGTDQSVKGFGPRQLYRELPGEIEARNVQSRKDMTPAELKAKPPWETADIDARPIMNQIFGGSRVGSLEGGLSSNHVSRIVPVEEGKAFGIPSKLPADDMFKRAVANTPGAKIDGDALVMPLTRRQRPEQELEESVRGGVFYLPKGSKDARFYNGKNENFAYGGTQPIEGETAIKAPLFVKGATGGKAPEAAFDSLLGKGSYQNMRTDALRSVGGGGLTMDNKVELASQFLEKYAPELAPSAWQIVQNSRKGNQMAYALQEAAVASAARRAGHDAVVGYSTKRGPTKEPVISEVFDVRESHYPGAAGEFETWPASMFGTGKVGALK